MTRILLTGKAGQLGSALQLFLPALGEVMAVGRPELDLTDGGAIRRTIKSYKPDIIVNAAGYTNVDKAESEPELAFRANAVAPGVMAEESQKLRALLVHYSTDYVYDGTKAAPYVEEDTPNPLNVYGKSKLEGERAISATGCRHLILRASWIYSASGNNFVLTILRLAREHRELSVVDDQVGSPSWSRPLAQASAELLTRVDQESTGSGIYHFSAGGHATRLEFAQRIVELARQSSDPQTQWARILPTTTANYPLSAQRPLHAATSKHKIKHDFGLRMPTWQEQLTAFMQSLSPR